MAQVKESGKCSIIGGPIYNSLPQTGESRDIFFWIFVRDNSGNQTKPGMKIQTGSKDPNKT